MQNRWPVGWGPSSKTCPRWASQREQTTSVLTMPWLASSLNSTFPGAEDSQKLGQPVPESNFVSEEKSSAPQQTQW